MNNMNDIINFITSTKGLLALLGITFTIEATPIKINPIGWLGNRLNKTLNDRMTALENKVNILEYNEDMKDLRNTKNRIHAYGMLIRKGEKLSYDTLKSANDDLDIYDFYKDTYKYMYINGVKVKINGEVDADRQLINNQMRSIKGVPKND